MNLPYFHRLLRQSQTEGFFHQINVKFCNNIRVAVRKLPNSDDPKKGSFSFKKFSIIAVEISGTDAPTLSNPEKYATQSTIGNKPISTNNDFFSM